MVLKKRVEVLFEPGDYSVLEREAGKRGESVGALIRQAVRMVYLEEEKRKRREAIRVLTSPQIELPDWEVLKKEMSESWYKAIMKSDEDYSK
jgi:hypothetical protein